MVERRDEAYGIRTSTPPLRFKARSLRFHRYAYLFVDGVHMSIRLGEDDRLCVLVVIGVREDGVKELLAVEDGFRENIRAALISLCRCVSARSKRSLSATR